MGKRPLLYYITDRNAFPGNELERRRRLLHKITEAAKAGVDYIQLREKDLCTRELESVAGEAVNVLNQMRTQNAELRTALLINSRTDVVLAAGADGVHLRSDDISPRDVRQIWQLGAVGPARDPLIGASCHSPEEVKKMAATGATFAAFGPIFEKKDAAKVNPAGLAQLQEACHHDISVFALGGITLSNAQSCLETGAAGIAAIRLFQENDIAAVVQNLISE
jgi:thiamine-phosphate pyrophosphorylase